MTVITEKGVSKEELNKLTEDRTSYLQGVKPKSNNVGERIAAGAAAAALNTDEEDGHLTLDQVQFHGTQID